MYVFSSGRGWEEEFLLSRSVEFGNVPEDISAAIHLVIVCVTGQPSFVLTGLVSLIQNA